MYVATVYCTNGLNSLTFLHQQKHIDMLGNYDIMKSEISFGKHILGGGFKMFQIFFTFTRIWGRFPWLTNIFF